MSRSVLTLVLAAAAAVALFPAGATASPPANPAAGAAATAPVPGIVAYREMVMSTMGKHMKMAGMIMKGEVDRGSDLLGHAKALHAASKDLVALFPAGTGPDKVKTEATAAVWTDAAKFAAAAATYEAETAKLVELVEAGDRAGAGAQLQKVGGACGGCHETFKAD